MTVYSSDDTGEDSKNGNPDLLNEIAEAFKKGVSIQDRKYHLKTYKQTFVGKEAVDFLVQMEASSDRADAVALGQTLMNELHLFEHVTRDHPFADDNLYYRFVEENERGKVAMNEETGKQFSWSDFLMPLTQDHASLLPQLPLPDFEAVPSKDTHVASKVWPLDEHNTVSRSSFLLPPCCATKAFAGHSVPKLTLFVLYHAPCRRC